MSADKQETIQKKRGKTSPSGGAEKAEEIIQEAEALSEERSKAASASGAEGADMEDRIRDSENKRLALAEALYESREKMRRMLHPSPADEARALPFGVFVRYGRDGQTAVIRHHGRLYEAKIKNLDALPEPQARKKGGTFHDLRDRRKDDCAGPRTRFIKGELLLLDNELHVAEPRGFELICGSLGSVQQVLNDEKLLIKTVGDETIIVTRAQPLIQTNIITGDNVEYDPDSLFAYSLLPKSNVDRLALEKVPDIGYDHIGGLDEAVRQIRDAIELPRLYPECFREHKLVPPKGIMLYGPPGCGKTLIAKAVANSLAGRIQERTGERGESYFLNVKGPELLNKYVGETEQAIRDLFARARSQASYRTPVIIFFDEMDSMFRVRGSGISSDMESTIVPQLLAELDGLEALENIVVIGATNREDLIDPAVLRPGRLDRKIRIPRPDKAMAVEIFAKYLTPDLPLAADLTAECGGPEGAVQRMIREVTDEMYSLKPENEFLEITYADGNLKNLYLKDFASGAIIENIVNRAKFSAVKRLIDQGDRGIGMADMFNALKQEFKENEDLPSSANPAEWHRIIGKGGERVVRIRTLLKSRSEAAGETEKPDKTVRAGDAFI